MMCLGWDWDPQTRKYGDRRTIDGTRPPGIPKKFSSFDKRRRMPTLNRNSELVEQKKYSLQCLLIYELPTFIQQLTSSTEMRAILQRQRMLFGIWKSADIRRSFDSFVSRRDIDPTRLSSNEA
ncbi:hypothetical protein DVH24_014885 [Malus domestica]|uniref:Uncharacterized protein n=1 Tax=Malus domestica TaxID=3750 RepID=A0A498K261_MALDO|nr:hypothetical protein DVH24_014885 [Malus domestica]